MIGLVHMLITNKFLEYHRGGSGNNTNTTLLTLSAAKLADGGENRPHMPHHAMGSMANEGV